MSAKFAPLSRLQSLGYASGNFGKNIVANTLGYFLLFYITDVLAIDPKLAGIIVFVALIVDAILDPVIGFISDRMYSHKFGKYGGFIVFGAPMCALSFIAIFFIPVVSGSPIVTLLACLLLFRASYTLIDLPHNALLSRISHNSRERAHLATLRFCCSSIGSLCVSLAAFYVFESDDSYEQAKLFQQFSIFAAICSLVAMWGSWYSIKQRDIQGSQSVSNWSQQIRGIKSIFTDKQALIILFASFFSAVSIPVFTKCFSFFCKYNLNDQSLIAGGLTLMVVAQTLSTPIWSHLSRRYEKHHTLISAHLLSIIAVSFFTLTVYEFNFQFIVGCALVGVAAGGLWSVIWGMAPDVVDKLNYERNIRSEAIFIALVVVLMKIGHGLGATMLGYSLTAFGYDANVEQSADVLLVIRTMLFAFPVVGSLICIIGLQQYQLLHAKHQLIQENLK